ncbi:ABC transporter substrate-binding protein [Labrenzia sp. 011]|uniref:ABC transporter substrate-binding protein n=1 Tax=Labrenzia sp. 011 TaxID=2171494 RepID=UPI000D5243BA|nr:ABC transporter substrate-binding protein [Labrenzia sp. 011]PVB59896.1 ABC transporter substrate-binding protein [Labrenzia sp. 011]
MTIHKYALALALTLGTTLASHAQDPVEIGMITTLSGPAGYLGQDIRDGLQLAIDAEGGKLGGVDVELVVEDDARKPANARQIAERFVFDDDIKLVTGIIFSNIAGAVVPDVVDSDAIYISPNAAPSTFAGENCNANYFVTSWQNDSLHEASGIAAKELGYKNAFVLAPNYQAGKDAVTGFKRMFGGEIVGEIYTQLDQTDYSAEMAQIRAAKPDVVFQFHPGGLGIAFLRQYQQAGLLAEIPMVLSEPSSDAVILNALGDAAIGLKTTAHWSPDFDNAASKEMMAAWKKAYPDRPLTYYATQGYDTGLAIASALKQTGGIDDLDAFKDALRKADFQSVRGNFSFGQNQHPVQDWYLLDVVAGEDGKPTTKTVRKLVENYGDVYAKDCKL